MSTLADRTISALRTNHDDMASLVDSAEETDLARQSGASDWDVAQVLSHIGSGAEIALAGLRSAAAGTETPGREFNQSVWDRWNAMTPPEQAQGFVRANDELVSAYEALDATTRDTLQLKLGFAPFPLSVAAMAGMRLNEASLHGWDVRIAFDDAAHLPAGEAALLLEHFGDDLGFLFGFVGKAAALDGNESTLRVEATNPDRAFGLRLGPTIGLVDAPSEHEGVLTGSGEALLRLFAGRLRDHETVSLTGDAVTLEQLETVFPGY